MFVRECSLRKVLKAFILLNFINLSLILTSPVATPLVRKLIFSKFIDGDVETLYDVWLYVFDKQNSIVKTDVYKSRLAIFKKNLEQIKEHNSKVDQTYTKGLNHFSDMTGEEIMETYGIKEIKNLRKKANLKINPNNNSFSLDDYIDNNDEDSACKKPVDHSANMNYPKDQKNCGSGWAFATIATLEGCYSSWRHKIEPLSTQQLIDCNKENKGCNGGWLDYSFEYFKSNSLIAESNYSYQEIARSCQYTDAKKMEIFINNYRSYDYRIHSAKDFDYLLQRGPIAVGVTVTFDWFHYDSGLFSGDCLSEINHVVVVIGYGYLKTQNCEKGGYYLVRNSWGSTWGEEGNIRILENKKRHSCNIEMFASQPTYFTKEKVSQ